MALVSMVHYRRRASRRMVADLPHDLAELEMDEPLQVMVKVREVVARDQAGDRGKIPSDRKAHWGVPSSPSSSRLRSADGLQSFHLARNKTSTRTAGSFDAYATKQCDRDAEADVAREREPEPEREHDERPAAAFDGYMRDHGGQSTDSPFYITNLHPDPARRGEQWDLIEQHERGRRVSPDAGTPRINIRYEVAPELLLAAAARNDCPRGLRDTILVERDRLEAGGALPKRQQRDGRPWIDPHAGEAIRWLEAQPGWEEWRGEKKRPAKLSNGRGTPTVWAGELELPHLLKADARRAVLRGLADFVQSQAAEDIEEQRARDRLAGDPEADTREWIVPVTGAVHVPGSLNDGRNAHLHPQFGTRIASVEAEAGLRFGDHKIAAMAGMGWERKLRCEAARLINIQLDAVGADYRLSPDTYARMGIDAPPMAAKVRTGTVLENAGVVVDAALANHAEGWRRQVAKADDEQTRAMITLQARDRVFADKIAERREDERSELEASHTAAYEMAKRAIMLQREAAELNILIAMATSRPERVRRFGDAYADAAVRKAGRDTYDASRWRERGREATRELLRLDGELAEERVQLRLRQQEAARLQDEATALFARLDDSLSVAPAAEPAAVPLSVQGLSAHQAVAVIQAAPLLLHFEAGRYMVRPEDDPECKVAGVNLAAPTIAARLTGIHAAQQKELGQLSAYGRKHGSARLRALADDDDNDEWLARSARRWRETPWMARLEDERRRIERAAMHRARLAVLSEDEGGDMLRPAGPAGALPDRIFNVPGGVVPPSAAALARHGVVLAPAFDEEAAWMAPRQPAVAIDPARSIAAQPDTPAPSKAQPWTDAEELLKRSVKYNEQDALAHADSLLASALEQWARDGADPSPLSARLLARVIVGFDPDGMSRTGRALSARDLADAEDLKVLVRDDQFAEWLHRARAKDPALAATVARITTKEFKPSQFGRVPLERGRLNFGFRQRESEERPQTLLPREWALRAVQRSRDAGQLDRVVLIDRGSGGSLGLENGLLVTPFSVNPIGVLYPDVQAELSAADRIRQEREHAIRAKLWSGEAMLDARLHQYFHDRSATTAVRLTGLQEEERRFASARGADRDFYLLCRAAELREGVEPEPLRHTDAVVRAWLRAKEEAACPSIVALLRIRVDVRKATMNEDELTSLTELAKPFPNPVPPRLAKRLQPKRRRPGATADRSGGSVQR